MTLTGVPAGCSSTNGLAGPAGLALDAQNETLYVAARDNCLVLAVNLGDGSTKVVAGGLAGSADGTGIAQFDHPTAIALDGLGNLYVADAGNATLRAVALPTGLVSTVARELDQAGVLLGAVPKARTGRLTGLAFLPGTGLIGSVAQENALLRIGR